MRIKAIVGALTLTAALSGCGANQRDLNGIDIKNPDKVEVYANIDEHPNIVRMCIGGIGFATISRQYNAILRVPEWDAWCK
jgi:hypothetical protein